MISRYFQKKIELDSIDNELRFKSPIELEYYLLESEINDCQELFGKKAYGVEIVKKINDQHFETESVRNLSCSKKSAQTILDKLAINGVTPVGLLFVIDDILAS